MNAADEVEKAAADCVAAFSRHDTAAYFATFAPSTTFIFHNTDQILRSRQEYEALWATWEADGFHVLGCRSLGGSVQMLSDDVGIFTHSVRTTLTDGDDSVKTGERETIVFQRIDGIWLGVHEHLSIDPTF
jgi:ketosteroid isomerase-like protein